MFLNSLLLVANFYIIYIIFKEKWGEKTGENGGFAAACAAEQ